MNKYLKLLFVALFASLSFALTSCGDDDDDEPGDGSLVGTWQENSILSESLGSEQYIQFNADHSFVEVDVYEYDDEVDVMYGRWERDGDQLTVSGADLETTTTKIKSLTSTTLELETYGIPTTYKKVSNSVIDKYLK